MDEWKPAAEHPAEEEIVILFMPNSVEPVWLGYFEFGAYFDCDGVRQWPTHWMPLPQPPGEVTKQASPANPKPVCT